MSHDVGIWIDHRKAVIVSISKPSASRMRRAESSSAARVRRLRALAGSVIASGARIDGLPF